MNKVIITGSEGFIGKALAAALFARGVEVIGIDRRIGIEAGEYFSHNSLHGIDCVFHLAAQTSVFNLNKNDIIRDNIDAFRIVCDTCARYGTRLVYASSSTANPENTTSLYGISKSFNEQYARCYYANATGVRFHNVYGPNPRQGTLLWYLLTQERVKLYNMGRNVRHFTYIDDIIESLLIAETSYGLPLINAANPQEVSTLKLASLVKQYKPLEIELVGENRYFDKIAQSVNESIYTLSLPYISVEEGVKLIFDSRK